MVKRLGGPTGVIHRVKGIKPSRSGVPPLASSHFLNGSEPLCMIFLPVSLSSALTSTSLSEPFLCARRIPLSSKVSRTAASLYASPSWCRPGSSGPGARPSWKAETLPPGKTCAEGKDDEVFTRCRRRIWFVGEMSTTLSDYQQAVPTMLSLSIP